MIHITMDMRPGHCEIVCDGHTNSDDPMCQAICAGVSAMMEAAALGLDALAKEYPDHFKVRVAGLEEGDR